MKRRIMFLIMALVLSLLALATEAQSPSTFPDLPGQDMIVLSQIGGISYTVALQGQYAYVSVGHRIAVIDVGDPTNPQFVGQSDLLPGIIMGIACVK